jgi:trimeric autotransporter adhesin
MSSTQSFRKSAIVVVVPFLLLVVACGTDTPTSPSAVTTSSAVAEAAGTATNVEPQGTATALTARTTTAAAPPTQEAPANRATDQPTTVTVRWHPVSTTSPIYNVQIARDSQFSSLVANVRITDGSVGYTVFNLAPGARYFWRVSLSGGGITSAWSSVWTFQTTSRDRPAAPTLLSPANGATRVPRSPTLVWSAVQGADSYQVEISPFGTAYFNVQGTSITLSEEALSIGYTDRHSWRVRAKSAAGASEWSELWVFTRTP